MEWEMRGGITRLSCSFICFLSFVVITAGWSPDRREIGFEIGFLYHYSPLECSLIVVTRNARASLNYIFSVVKSIRANDISPIFSKVRRSQVRFCYSLLFSCPGHSSCHWDWRKALLWSAILMSSCWAVMQDTSASSLIWLMNHSKIALVEFMECKYIQSDHKFNSWSGQT